MSKLSTFAESVASKYTFEKVGEKESYRLKIVGLLKEIQDAVDSESNNDLPLIEAQLVIITHQIKKNG